MEKWCEASSLNQEVRLFPWNSSGVCFRHVLMFLQLTKGQGFPDQDAKASSEEKQQLHYTEKSTRYNFCHTDETNIFHNKSWLLVLVQKTTHIRIFTTVRKGVWENTSKKSHRWRVKNKTAFLSEHTYPHMHTGKSSLEREHAVWMCLVRHSAMGVEFRQSLS